MDFGLSEDQVLLQDTLKRFLAEKCPTTRVRDVMASESGHDESLWRGIADLGAMGILVPAVHGGMGGELLDLALVAEELGYAAAPGPFLGSAMATVALAEGADSTLRERWLPALATGHAIGTVAFGEEGSQLRPVSFNATVQDGRLSGIKPMVPYARAANFVIVAARDEQGPGLWLVEREAAGVAIVPQAGNDMTRRLDHVTFENTPATALGGNRAALGRTLDAGLILVAADAYGGCRRCLSMSASYALQREQFGQPIGAFQAVKHQLANMAMELEPSLALIWYSAHAFDRIRDQSERHAAIVKAHMADVFDRITRDATELHGGIGFTWEFDLHLWFRRAIFDRSFLGTATYHRARAADLAGW